MSIVINNNNALVKHTQTLYNDKTKSDFKLIFIHNSNKKEIIYVHQIILCQSRYFFNILNNSNNSESKKKEMKITEQEREDSEVFKDMIKLAYGFSISIKHYTNLISLLILVNRYQFEEIEETIKTIVLEQFSCDNIPKENALWLWYTFGLKSDGTLTYPYDDISNGFIKSSKGSYRRLALEQIENDNNGVESTPVTLVTISNSSFGSGSNQSNQSACISNVSFVEELERIIETNYIYNNCNDSINSEDKRSTIYGDNNTTNNLQELSKFIKTLNLQCFHSFIDKFITNNNSIQFSTDLLQYWISGNPKQRLTEAGTLLLKIKQSQQVKSQQQEQSRNSNDCNSDNYSNISSFPSWVIKNNLVKK